MSHQRGHPDQLGPGKIIRFDATRDNYILLKKLSSVSSDIIVYKAQLYVPDDDQTTTNNYLVLKMISLSLQNECRKLRSEYIRSYGTEDHNNVVGIKRWFCVFKDGYTGVEMPYMDEGSLRYIVSATRFKNGGLPEDCMAVALREALLGLSFIHSQGRVHKHFSAANIVVNGGPNASIKPAFEASMHEHQEDGPGGSSSTPSAALDLKEITKWAAAPEVYRREDSGTGGGNDGVYGPKADIWLVGITALELAYGCNLAVADREDLEAIIKKVTKEQKQPISFGNKFKKVKMYLQKKVKAASRIKTLGDAAPDSKEKEEDDERPRRVFSRDFEKMVAKCLAKTPAKRPTADELLHTKFIRNSKDINHFKSVVLQK